MKYMLLSLVAPRVAFSRKTLAVNAREATLLFVLSIAFVFAKVAGEGGDYFDFFAEGWKNEMLHWVSIPLVHVAVASVLYFLYIFCVLLLLKVKDKQRIFVCVVPFVSIGGVGLFLQICFEGFSFFLSPEVMKTLFVCAFLWVFALNIFAVAKYFDRGYSEVLAKLIPTYLLVICITGRRVKSVSLYALYVLKTNDQARELREEAKRKLKAAYLDYTKQIAAMEAKRLYSSIGLTIICVVASNPVLP